MDLGGPSWEEARYAFLNMRFRDAALIMEQARERAIERGDKEDAAFSSLTAGWCWRKAGHYLNSVQRLAEALAAEVEDSWSPQQQMLIREERYLQLLEFSPGGNIKRAMENLQHADPEDSDVALINTAVLWEMQGRFSDALRLVERLVAKKFGDVNYHPHTTYFIAGRLNLKLGKREPAREWFAKLESDRNPDCQIMIFERYELEVMVALDSGERERAEKALAALADVAVGCQGDSYTQRWLSLNVQFFLTGNRDVDPLSREHPALDLLRKVRPRWLNQMARYERNLLIVAYRRACADFTLKKRGDSSEGELAVQSERNKKVVAAAVRAKRYAKFLDACFGCDWRQREVDGAQVVPEQ